MRLQELNDKGLIAEACGRRLKLVEFRLALISKIPNKNRMRRTWVSAHPAEASQPRARLSATIENGFLRIAVEVWPGDPVWFFEGVHLRFEYTGQSDEPSHQSYFAHNSFAFNGIRPELKRKIALKDGAPKPSRANQLMFRERRGVAWWMTALKSTRSAKSIFLGVESASALPTTFTVFKTKSGHHQVDVYQGLQGEYVHLNRRIDTDPVLIRISDTVLRAMEDYGLHVGSKNGARRRVGTNRGWSSWYKYYPRISEGTILYEAERLKRALPEFGLLQIDDGYQPKVGDWTSKDDTFPSGLQETAAAIRKRGLKPGIWMAPFMVDKTSSLARTRASKDWFLHSFKGKLLTYKIPRHSTNYILDVTHPEAEKCLRENIRRFRDWGFEYLKIDFLMLQAAQARRFDPSITGMEAYRKGLSIVREELGPDGELLLSGSIAPAGIGIGDANRTGPDIAYDILGGNTRLAFIKAQLASTAAHHFTGGRWYTPNPDAAVIRPPLKDSLVEAMLAQVAMAGGDFILSDAIEELSAERIRKVTHPVFARMTSAKGRLIPLDYFENVSPIKIAPNPLMVAGLYNPPRVWLWSSDQERVLLLYNLATAPTRFRTDLKALLNAGMGDSAFQDQTVKDIFHGQELKIANGAIDLEIPRESVRIFPLNG